ncbi:MAG: L,D-transpeptidase family protein [Phenylobacterium sp.]
MMIFYRAALYAGASLFLLAACSKPAAQQTAQAAPPQPAAAAANTPAPEPVDPLNIQAAQMTPIEASVSPMAAPIDKAVWTAEPVTPEAKRNAMLRAQVLLARAHFSPGVIDGQDGGNVKNAIAAFEAAHDLPVDGVMDDQVWAALSKDEQPALTDYVITPDDAKGPFVAKIPTDYAEMAKLPALGFSTPSEALAEKFHMDEALLKALNPGADFGAAGTRIVVAALGPDKLPGAVARIEVDKTKRQIRAFGDGDVLLAVYPATVGSSERPAPAGEWEVRTTAPNPTYTYDPSRLTFGKASQGKLTIKAGPNNPVGSTWIDLTKDTFGIHGTPDPRLVGKTASHGCVRLTNWDVRQLSLAVRKGTKVDFVGVEQASAPTKAGV